MGKVLLGMSMSLDGYIRDAHGSDSLYDGDYDISELLAEWIRDTGAVVMGRMSYQMESNPDLYADTYEFQVPLFVVTHEPPAKLPKHNDKLTFTFVTDGVESAIRQAKAAGGDKQVMVVGGADLAQQLLRAGLVDEIEVGILPVLLGGGLRLFDHLGADRIKLEKTRVKESGPRTDIWFKVLNNKAPQGNV